MKELCNNNQLYLIKVVGEGGVGELQSYTSACTLLESGLAETLIFNLDWRGSLVAVNLAVRTEEAPYKGRNRDKFDTKVQIQHMENGPTPDTAAFIQRMEEEKTRKMTGQSKDEKSFFSKYWMYIVPVCIFMLINGMGGDTGGAAR